MLIQSADGNKYNHMYVVNNWKKSEFAVAKLSGIFPVMVELTQDAIQMNDSLSNQNLTNKL